MQYLKKRFSLIELNVCIPAILFIAVIILCLTIYPQDTSRYINKIHHFLTWEMGGIFLVMTFLVVLCCLWLAFSRYGDILLGQSGEKPDFSLLTWLGLIFTSGTGGSLLYLASVEWIWIIQQPPFGATAGSAQAARWASAYGMFHWGPSAWAWYLICAVPIGWFMHVKKTNSLKVSDLCRGCLGARADGFCGHLSVRYNCSTADDVRERESPLLPTDNVPYDYCCLFSGLSYRPDKRLLLPGGRHSDRYR